MALHRRMLMAIALIVTCLALSSPIWAAESPVISRVIDGDTIEVVLPSGQRETVRLIGVDTPETVHPTKGVQPWGPEASAFTKKLLPIGTTITMEMDVQERDNYGRLLTYVYLPDGRMLNSVLLEEGMAQLMTIPPNVKYVSLFTRLQAEARQNGRGMWHGMEIPSTGAISLVVDVYDETATIINRGKDKIDISGWKLVSVTGNQSFTLPAISLPPNTQVTVCSGPNADRPGCITWTKANIWNNAGDPGELYDTQGHLAASTTK